MVRITSSSRPLNRLSPSGARPLRSASVARGSNTISPRATRRSDAASSVAAISLNTKPQTPAASASVTGKRCAADVNMRLFVRGQAMRMRVHAATPFSPGISKSTKASSGCFALAIAAAPNASEASPTMEKSGNVSKNARRPRRTTS